MDKLSEQLQAQRKSLKPPQDYPKLDNYKGLKQAGAYPLHESTKPGILDLDIHP